MKRLYNLIFILFFINKVLISQEFQLGVCTGLGSFAMTDLKKFSKIVLNSIPFQPKILENFPAYWFYRPSIIFKNEKFGFGVCYNFESTGSRMSLKDYTGEYKLDILINSNTPCFLFNYDIKRDDRFVLDFYIVTGFGFTNLKVKEYFNLFDSVLANFTDNFYAQNQTFEPGFDLLYKVHSVGFKLNVGYLFQSKDESFSKSQHFDLSSYKPNWTGYRIGLTFFYYFKIKLKNEKNIVKI